MRFLRQTDEPRHPASVPKTTLGEAAEVAAREAKAAGLDEAALDIIKRKIPGI